MKLTKVRIWRLWSAEGQVYRAVQVENAIEISCLPESPPVKEFAVRARFGIKASV